VILRDYQEAAVEAVLREFERVQSTLVQLPTGCGKTLVAAEVVRRYAPNASVFLSHRKEIIRQSQITLERHGGTQCETEQGDSRASEIFPADCLLASVQTMVSGRKDARRMHKFSPYNYKLVICDEAHHFIMPSFREVIDYFKSGGDDIKFLFLTATPKRTDKLGLFPICESVAYEYPIRNAIDDGWLVPVAQQLIDIQSLDFSHIRTTAGDLNAGDLAAVMEAERNLYGICDAATKELKDSDKCIMFTATVKQAQMSADILNRYRAGIALFASGKTRPDERDRIMRDFREGRNGCQYFVNCGLVSEGFDVPDANKLIQAKPTKSPLVYTQQLGRIMRPLPGTVDNVKSNAPNGAITSIDRRNSIKNSRKNVATVMDFAGNAGRHKLVHAIDVLGGKISEHGRELAERELRKTGAPMDVDEIVEEADRLEREERERLDRARRAKLIAKATYTARYVDPFDAFDIVAPNERAHDRGKHLSERQRALLAKQGLDPDRLSYTQGQTILNELFSRWDKGLCSLKQAALLKRFGYETKGVTREQAGAIITQLKANNWQRPVVQSS
jgi:superfamily II DNA or RNA helicase